MSRKKGFNKMVMVTVTTQKVNDRGGGDIRSPGLKARKSLFGADVTTMIETPAFDIDRAFSSHRK